MLCTWICIECQGEDGPCKLTIKIGDDDVAVSPSLCPFDVDCEPKWKADG